MMKTRRMVRVVFVACLVLASIELGMAAVGSGSVEDRYQNAGDESVAPSSNGITVVTTSPREGTDASMFAIGPDGRVLYYEDEYRKYFDVDPVPNTTATVEFIANKDNGGDCPEGSEPCPAAVMVRVNISTGEREVFQQFLATGRSDWHDYDRIGPHRLLIADINDEIRIYNTSTDTTEWAYHFRADYNRSDGGTFPNDWTHLNDVEWLGDGIIMASPRNMDSVVFIHRERGLIENRTLGTDGNHSRLFEQHNPDYIPAKRGGPAVLVADSENNRIIEYQREDERWVRSWSWQDARMSWPRDADRLPNGNTLVTDSNGNRILEVNQNGRVVWSIPVDTPYEAERLGSGDESSGGESATRLDLRGQGGGTVSDPGSSGESAPPLPVRIVAGISDLLPSLVVNGVLFILPPWMGALEVLVLVFATSTLVAWGGLEAYWRGYRIQTPVIRR